MNPWAQTKPEFDAVQAALRCASCGGQKGFDPQTQSLRCDSCGRLTEIVVDSGLNPRREAAYDPGAPEDEPPEIEHAHRCDTCGGEVVFVGRAVSEQCPYCNGSVVLFGGHSHYTPSALIPIGNTKADAGDAIACWVRGLWSAPTPLSKVVTEGQIAAVYAPFWTFDAAKDVNYTAQRRTGHGESARWRRVSGQVMMVLDDVVIGASDHVTPDIRDGIMHGFYPQWLKPYQPEYLAGFAADLHGSRVSDGLIKLRRDIEEQVRRRIQVDAGGGRIRNITWTGHLSEIRFRRVLLPLWILHYRYAGKPYRIVVSGIDGRCFGERPFSMAKLFGWALLSAASLFGAGMMIGAGLAPG
ncbi:hypothetical protein [uncultured Roseovarius sp.]|uniref:hypothetical protein n=1 Tax=uncultured Roseovarius sp. TaxID=293344 RepID=UPI00261CAF0E|nr:hypothetical protein [uncultured Roseovarius sp.]